MTVNCLVVAATTETPILIKHDVEQQFELVLFNYHNHDSVELASQWEAQGFNVDRVINDTTECKGDYLLSCTNHISTDYDYIAFWDHDLCSKVSDINTLFSLGHLNDWHWYQPSLNNTSHYTYDWTLSNTYPEYWRAGKKCRYTYAPFVEIMAPFFSGKLWRHCIPMIQQHGSISGYGLDMYLIPEALAWFEVLTFPVIVKSIAIKHINPITSNQRQFKNGLTAYEELEWCKAQKCKIVKQLYQPEPCIDIQCISLNDSSCDGRKEQFKRAAAKHHLEFTFSSAIDARNYTQDKYPTWIKHKGRRVDWYEPLKPGEVGVAVSHKALYLEGWVAELSAMVIFEDDAVLIQDMETLPVVDDTDLLMLSNRWMHDKTGRVVGNSCGTEGYLITRRGMHKMLQILEHMNMPLDLMMIAHCQSMIDTQHGLTTVRNPLNPVLNIYHHQVYCIANDQGVSTVQ